MANNNNNRSRAQVLGLGDFDDDPRARGILPNTGCRSFRQRLRTSRKINVFQGLAIATGGVALLAVLILIGMDVAAAGDSNPGITDRVKELWDSALAYFSVPEVLERAAEKQVRPGFSLKAYAIKKYCEKPPYTKVMFDQIRKKVLNQPEAIDQMEKVMSRQRQFQSMVLYGQPGVGKTLTVSALRHYFPWPCNVHAFSGLPCPPGKERECPVLRKFLDDLSDYGTNLLVIDDLVASDHSSVATYNRVIRESLGQQSVLVVYIMTMDVMQFYNQFNMLELELPADTPLILFNFFGRIDLRECLENELKREGRYLENDEKTRILDEALDRAGCDGCKGLREIVLQQGLLPETGKAAAT